MSELRGSLMIEFELVQPPQFRGPASQDKHMDALSTDLIRRERECSKIGQLFENRERGRERLLGAARRAGNRQDRDGPIP